MRSRSRKERPNENELEWRFFDFLDAKDGATVKILHTGNTNPRFPGTVKGMPEGVRDLGDLQYKLGRGSSRGISGMVLVRLLVCRCNHNHVVFANQTGSASYQEC